MNKKHALILFIILSVSVTGLFVYAADALTITTVYVPDGEVGQPYHTQITAAGGSEPYTYTLAKGRLPDGLTLNSATGVIEGTPLEGGGFLNLIFQVTDQAGQTAQKKLRIDVEPRYVSFKVTDTVWTYDGLEHKATVQPVEYPKLVEGVDYRVTYGEADSQKNVGSYRIAVKMINPEYAVKSQSYGVLTIYINETSSINLQSKSFPYDGQTHELEPVVKPEGLKYTVTYTGVGGTNYGPTSSPPVAVGTYRVTVETTDSNYTLRTAAATMQISKPSIRFVVKDSEQVYANGNPLQVTVEPETELQAGLTYKVAYRSDTEPGNPLLESVTEAGSYQIQVTLYRGTEVDENYEILLDHSTFTVLPVKLSFLISNTEVEYIKGNNRYEAMISTSPAGVSADCYTIIYTDQNGTKNENFVTGPGIYSISVEMNSPNYTADPIDAVFAVTNHKEVNFVISGNTSIYDPKQPTYGAVITPSIDNFTSYRAIYTASESGQSTSSVSEIGSYTIRIELTDSDYDLGTITGDAVFTLQKRHLLFDVEGAETVYNGTSQTVTIVGSNSGYDGPFPLFTFDNSATEEVEKYPYESGVTDAGIYTLNAEMETDSDKFEIELSGQTFTISKRPIDFTITQTTATQSAAQVEYQAAVTPSVEGFTGYSVFYEGADGSTCGAVTVPGVYAIHIELTEEGKKNNELRRITPDPAEFTLYEAEPEPEPEVYSIRLDYGNSPYGAIMGMNWSEQAKLTAKEAFAANRVFSADTVPDGYRSGLTYSALAWVGGSGAEGAAPAPDADLDETAVFVYGGTGGYIEPGYTVEKDGGTAVRTGAENGTVTATVKQLKVGAEAPKDVIVGSEEWNALKGKRVVPGIYSVEYFYQVQVAGATASAVRTAVFLDRIGDANSDGTTNGIDGNYLKWLIQNGTEAVDAVIRYRVYDVNHDGAVDEADSAAILNRMNQPLNEYYR